MKKWIWFVLGVVLALVVIGALVLGQQKPGTGNEQETKQQSGGSAPNFTVLDADGNEVQLSDFYGRPIVLNFWATWCGYCVREMPDFDKACKENPDVVFLMVNATDGVHETVSKAKAYVAEQGFCFDVYFDTRSQAVTAYHITGYPTTVFIDANGDVVSKQTGMISYDTLIAGIQAITGE